MLPEPPSTPPRAHRFHWLLIAALTLGITLLAAYANSFRVPFLFDDISSIGENLSLRSWRTAFFPPGDSGITASGRPLLNASLAFNYALHGESLAGYHAVNLLLHFLAALTLFGLLRRTLVLPSLREKFAASSGPLALAVSTLWALHPLQTESVTYIVQRAEVLVGLFYFLTLYAFIRATETNTSAAASRRWQIATFAACLLGMASKEVMISAPLVVLLFDRTFVAGSFATAWRARRGLYLSLAATWILLAACILSTGNRGGTVGVSDTVTSWTYLLTQGDAILHYLRLVFWPHPLVLDHGTAIATGFAEAAVPFFILIALGALTVFAIWRRPILGFPAALFFAALAPTSSVVPVLTQTVAEHRMYLPLAAVLALLVLAIHRRFGPRSLLLWPAVALVLATLTFRRNHDYRDAFAIWYDTLAKAPLNARAHNNLGHLFIQKKDYASALQYYVRSIELAPKDPSSWVGHANILVMTGRMDEALRLYVHAIAMSPRLFEAHYNYGKALLEAGHIEEALLHTRTAVDIRPSATDARHNFGNALVAAGRPAEAITAFESVLADDPSALDTRNNLANTLVALGRAEEAVRLLQETTALAPDSAATHLNLGRAFMTLARTVEGIAAFTEAVRLDPSLREAHANLANALLAAQRPADALPHYRTALQLGLTDPVLHLNFGKALAATGRFDEALDHLRNVSTSSHPSSTEALHTLARLLLQHDRADEAAPLYDELRKRLPDSAEIANEAGIAFAQTDRLPDAVAAFERALQLRPDFAEARENLQRARGL